MTLGESLVAALKADTSITAIVEADNIRNFYTNRSIKPFIQVDVMNGSNTTALSYQQIVTISIEDEYNEESNVSSILSILNGKYNDVSTTVGSYTIVHSYLLEITPPTKVPDTATWGQIVFNMQVGL